MVNIAFRIKKVVFDSDTDLSESSGDTLIIRKKRTPSPPDLEDCPPLKRQNATIKNPVTDVFISESIDDSNETSRISSGKMVLSFCLYK